MTIPLVDHRTIWDAIAATTTVELHTQGGQFGQVRAARAIFLEVNGGSTPDWTLAIQGKVSESATYHNINFFRVDQGTTVTPSATTLSVNWTTAQYYVIPNPPPYVQLVGTRTGGTLTVYAAFSTEAYSTDFPTVALTSGGVVDTELPAAVAMNGTIIKSAVAPYMLAAAGMSDGTNIVQEQAISIASAYATVLAVGPMLDNGASMVGIKAASGVAAATGVGTVATALVPTSLAATAPSNVTTTAAAASGVIKASPGTLYGFSGYNAKVSAQFIELFDSTTVPADTGQSVLVITVPASSNFSYTPGIYGRRFATGIAWANSSTQPLKTVGSADCHMDVQYV